MHPRAEYFQSDGPEAEGRGRTMHPRAEYFQSDGPEAEARGLRHKGPATTEIAELLANLQTWKQADVHSTAFDTPTSTSRARADARSIEAAAAGAAEGEGE